MRPGRRLAWQLRKLRRLSNPRAGVRQPDAPPPSPPLLEVNRASGEIDLDGKLDDDPWTHSRRTGPFVNTIAGGSAQFTASARALWDAEHLYIGFEVEDDFIRSTYEHHDDTLWKQDCVEVFVDPDGDGKNYFEMQVSPTGVTFDTFYASRRRPQPVGHLDWESGLVAGVSQTDEGYAVEMAIPWSAFAYDQLTTPVPTPGDTWRANFYVMDRRRSRQRAAGWSPPMVGDFHVPKRFGRLRFLGAPPKKPTRAIQMAPERAKRRQDRLLVRERQLRERMIREKVRSRRHPGEPPPARAPEPE